MRAFSDLHPAVPFVCLTSCVCVAMLCTSPVIAALSFIGAAALWLVRNGVSRPKEHLICLAALVVIPLINMLFSHNGATVLLIINDSRITLEALVYGLISAVTLLAVLYWFRSFSQIMTADRLLCLTGRLSPRLALILTMALRFVPHFRQQAGAIDRSQRALGLYKDDNIIDLIRSKLRVFSILVTWALENGITTADSMTARGYGTGRRTAFSVFRFRRSDGVVLAICTVLLGVCLWGLLAGSVDYSCYPTLDPVPHSPLSVAAYISYGGLVLLPAAIEAEVKIRWHSLRSAT